MYKQIIRPILDHLDSESMHNFARESLRLAEISPFTLRAIELCTGGWQRVRNPRLETDLGGGLVLENPLIVGAGWDKAGRALMGLWHLGFAGVEVGSVVEHPQEGNPKPRQYMLSPGVCLNWLSFNSPGMDVVARNLDRYVGRGVTIGISVGLNKNTPHKDAPQSHATVVKRMYDYADYFAINVSSPNTPGLRDLQAKSANNDIVAAVNETMTGCGGLKPLFVKIAPELTDSDVDDLIEVALDHNITGLIATNTAALPELKSKYGAKWMDKPGGLSGDDPDYRKMATEKIRHIYKQAGDSLKIMGVGGVKDPDTALEKIRAGATALQLVTAIRGEGTAVACNINRGILEYMETEGISSLSEIVGADV